MLAANVVLLVETGLERSRVKGCRWDGLLLNRHNDFNASWMSSFRLWKFRVFCAQCVFRRREKMRNKMDDGYFSSWWSYLVWDFCLEWSMRFFVGTYEIAGFMMMMMMKLFTSLMWYSLIISAALMLLVGQSWPRRLRCWWTRRRAAGETGRQYYYYWRRRYNYQLKLTWWFMEL